MGNEDRIKQWQAARQARLARGEGAPAPIVDDDVRVSRSGAERAEAQTAPSDRGSGSQALPDEVRLEEARLSIIERRRARWRILVRRAMVFVAIPLLMILLYMGLAATKLYQGEAVFTVQTSAEAAPSPSAGIFGVGAGNSTISDAFKAREFILSRPMMEHMEERFGFMGHFASFRMDPLTRFDSPVGINQDPYDYYRKRVRVAVDVQEGILRLYVHARTPEDAIRFGNGILAAAEAHVNNFSDKISEDQISSLSRDVQNAERQVAETRRSLASVQARRGELSPQQTAAAVYQLISQLELQLAEAERERNALLEQGLTESPLLPRLNARVEELRAQISEQRGRLANPSGSSLSRTLSEYESATANQEIAKARLESTLSVLQQAYLRILEQRRYFVLVVGMSVGGTPEVRDVLSIAIPILILLALIYALAFVARRVSAETGRGPAFSQVVDRWRSR